MPVVTWPALIDVHVHLREPAATHKEDFLTGSQAAQAGGFGWVIDMPNNPIPTITMARLKEKIALAKKAVVEVGFYFGTNGRNLNELPAAARHPKVFGLKLYCNHTTGEMLIEDVNLLAKVFAAWPKGKPILVHAEGVQLAAVIGLAALYRQRLHVCHISQAVEVELVKKAKKAGIKITAGVTPHHLWLPFNSALMKPPLGSKQDQSALWRGLNEGAIDIVESDHAPHTLAEKQQTPPAFGVPGLETTLGLMLLGVKKKKCTLAQVKIWLYDKPRKIFNIPASKNTIKFDPHQPWVVQESNLKTKCGWSPFLGWQLYGKVRL